MSGVWRKLCGLFRNYQPAAVVTPLPAVPLAARWTKLDMENLAHVFSTPMGKKLLERMKATEYDLAVRNAQQRDNSVHAAGVTTGYNHALRHLISLSYSCDGQQETKNDSGAHGEARPVESEREELDELLERMSPNH